MRSLRIERDPLEPILEHLTGLRKRVPGRDTEGPISRGQAPLVRGSSNFQGPSSKESQTAALGKSGALIKRGVHRLDMVHGFHPWLHAFAPPGLETSDASSHPIHPGPNSRLFLFVPFDPFVVRKTHQPFRAFRVIRGPLFREAGSRQQETAGGRRKISRRKTQDRRPLRGRAKDKGQSSRTTGRRRKISRRKTGKTAGLRAGHGSPFVQAGAVKSGSGTLPQRSVAGRPSHVFSSAPHRSPITAHCSPSAVPFRPFR
jgi:hypothetical protein